MRVECTVSTNGIVAQLLPGACAFWAPNKVFGDEKVMLYQCVGGALDTAARQHDNVNQRWYWCREGERYASPIVMQSAVDESSEE